MDKGLVKIKNLPKNRYLYYLTPEGFTERTKLTAEYLKSSSDIITKNTNSKELIIELKTPYNKFDRNDTYKVSKSYRKLIEIIK